MTTSAILKISKKVRAKTIRMGGFFRLNGVYNLHLNKRKNLFKIFLLFLTLFAKRESLYLCKSKDEVKK